MPPRLAASLGHRPLPDSIVAAAIVFLALAFVLPNHAPPWTSFLQEALAASALIVLATPVLLLDRGGAPWRLPELVVLGLLAVPPIQYFTGLIPFAQTAWMPALFLSGLLVSMLTGAALERRTPGRVLGIVLASAWLAANASVGLQLYQWLVLPPGEGTLWVYRVTGARPAGNLGQANALATLLIFGLLGTHALWRSARIGSGVAFAVAAYQLLGLALTQSRTGMLNALIVAIALVLWPRRAAPRVAASVAGLLALLCVAFAGYSAIGARLGLPLDTHPLAERATLGLRAQAWSLFADAALQKPTLGYGWGQSFQAQIAAALDHPALHRVFLSAHNLPLELALWIGVPLAAFFTAVLAWWLVRCARGVNDGTTLALLLFIVVLLVHSMLEFPLHYAYFLLPAGLVAGALGERVGLRPVWRSPPWPSVVLLLAVVGAFGITVRDYLRVERSYGDLLIEKARIHVKVAATPPDVLVLTSLRDLIVFSRLVPRVGMPATELSWMQDVVRTHPGAAGFEKLARALALNGRPDEAQRWVDSLCRIFAAAQCAALGAEWSEWAERQPTLRAIHWP